MTHFRQPRRAPFALALLAATGGIATAQTTFFGDYVGGNEFYVALPPLGSDLNPGTLAQPFATIDGALANVAGQIGVVPVSINLIGAGPFEQDTTPITIPAHGVSIEAYDTRAGGLPSITAPAIFANNAPPELLWINTVGNEALPPSVVRGIRFANTFAREGQPPTANLRIEVAGVEQFARIAPEIRDCVFEGEPNDGVQIYGTDAVTNETVFERNHITAVDPFFGAIGLEILGTEDDAMSPLVRSNYINRYRTNVSIEGGGMSNQTRLQSNFIQVGNTNVTLDDCAPYLVNNTIAFATGDFTTGAVGLEWSANMPALGLSNNLIWNPDQNGLTIDDVSGSMAVFANAPTLERIAMANFDEDDTFFNETQMNTPNVFTQLAVQNGDFPNFFGGDTGLGTQITDLHITEDSAAIDQAFTSGLLVDQGDPLYADVPSAAGDVPVRRGVPYDIDFGSRVAGEDTLAFFGPADVGADEFIEVVDPAATSFTRGGTLQRTIGATFGTDLDTLGSIFPDPATGEWRSQVEVLGVPGDSVSIRLCVGFEDTVTHSDGTVLENRAVYDHLVLAPGSAPGLVTTSVLGMQLDPNQIELAGGTIPANGVFVANIALGAVDPSFFEAEMYLQAWVGEITPSNTLLLQTTNRMTLEANE